MTVVDVPIWRDYAACRDADLEAPFARQACHQQWFIQAYCDRCPVRAECLDDALTTWTDEGIWGGMIKGDRVRLRRALKIPAPRGRWNSYDDLDVRHGTVNAVRWHYRREGKGWTCGPCRAYERDHQHERRGHGRSHV